MTLVIGIGNDFRRDDRAGLAVARGLRHLSIPKIEIAEASGEGTQLMDLWEGKESVILVDATLSGGSPGSIRRFEANLEALPARSFRYSTHAFSLGEAIEMARALGKLPGQVTVYGIEGKDFSPGEGLSPEVASSVDKLIAEISVILV